ncbi:MAG: hypothetical protein LUG66_05265 [Clostridiales bacterium]|nr:hypothetical protein [Clostridiales bacterium]
MKNLSEIQLEIRELEKQASDILNRLSALERDIGEIREAKTGKSNISKENYSRLEELAESFKFGTHPINTYNRETAAVYIKALMLFIISGKGFNSDGAVFIQWIIKQSVLSERSFESFMKDCCEAESYIYDEIKECISSKPLKQYLAVDIFMLIGLTGDGREELYEIAGAICGIMEISKNNIFDCIKLSKSVLCQSVMRLPKRIMKLLLRDFSFYITDDNYEAKLLNKTRSLVLKWDKTEISYYVKSGTYVKQGQMIAHKKDRFDKKFFCAGEDGCLYHFNAGDLRYFIISPKPEENKESLIKWLKETGEMN